MIATVTLNPSLDKTIYVERLELDDSNRAMRYRFDPGGKGINISRVLWELSEPSLLFGFLGGNTGKEVGKYLQDEGLSCDFNWTNGETRENLIITTGEAQLQTKINLPGPLIRDEEVHRLKRKITGRTRDFEVLALSGSLPPGVDNAIYKELAEEAIQRGDRVILDADGEALRLGLKAKPFMIKPNLHELQRLMGRPLPDADAIHGALDELLLSKTVELVILTQGSGSVIAATRDERIEGTPPAIQARSTVGAGDSMIAGFLHAYFKERSLEDALRWGIAAGTACASSIGTELAHLSDIRLFLPQVQLKHLSVRPLAG
jgi:1-phosphofructokinase